MNGDRQLIALLVGGIVVLAVGSLVVLARNTLGSYPTKAGAVVVLLLVSLLVGSVLGMKGREWLRNPGYW
ncbi:hypothetical protein BRC71_07370 [Halobacteriales archaeon QH_7_65_31]|nr:MAG: hypothetical protein BRC71_07370 [Halobacteriales archaeon QH_7_65_31]